MKGLYIVKRAGYRAAVAAGEQAGVSVTDIGLIVKQGARPAAP